MRDEIELIENISNHPIYGIVDHYQRICIRDQWYDYDGLRDRLVRSTNSGRQEDLLDGEERGLL